jgi:hypothetical protein
MQLIPDLSPTPLDTDTFLTVLYVEIDDFFQREGPPEPLRPGRKAALNRSEVLCLSLFGQWGCFSSQRDFWRYASRHLRAAFPGLGARSQFNRAQRAYRTDLERVALGLAARGVRRPALYEAVDLTAAPTRNLKRRGVGWLYGEADIGWSNRLGWFEGFKVIVSCSPEGRISGFGFGPASEKDQRYAEHFLALRHAPALRAQWPSVGPVGSDFYVLDKGFAGQGRHAAWRQAWGVDVLCAPPAYQGRVPWPKAWRRQVASRRQIVETVWAKLQHLWGLAHERPHALQGFAARLAARVGLHNFCFWLNRQLGRPGLAMVDLVDCWAT